MQALYIVEESISAISGMWKRDLTYILYIFIRSTLTGKNEDLTGKYLVP